MINPKPGPVTRRAITHRRKSDESDKAIESLGLSFESKPINRITSALFWQERPKYPLNEEQLAEHLANCGDDEEPINFDLEAFGKAIAEKLTQAGGSDYLRTLPGPIWLVENEVNGWTLMLPSDY